jgi:NAD(P)-dependent dehydrogenase (short-subunit alcohol dehydrogenase family)
MVGLANKAALITGASRGMGRATALALAAAGARIIVHYGRNAGEADAVVDQIRKAQGRADAIYTDLAMPDGPHALAAHVRSLVGERLDILVLNAGISSATSSRSRSFVAFGSREAVAGDARWDFPTSSNSRGLTALTEEDQDLVDALNALLDRLNESRVVEMNDSGNSRNRSSPGCWRTISACFYTASLH